MNCPHCQRELPPDTKFCPACGGRVQFEPPTLPSYADPYQQRAEVRQREMNSLGDLIRYFSPKQPEYDAYDDSCKKIIHFARGARSALLVWGCIILSLGLFVFLANIEDADLMDDLVGISVVFLLPGIAMLVGGILLKVNNRKKYDNCMQTYRFLSQSLYKHYYGYPNCPVGPEYTNPRILSILMRNVSSGRCDTIQQSINCMIADANYVIINRYCEQIRQQTASVNAGTGVTTIFAAPEFFR